ncbi:hypothetical protein DWB63_09945 [Pseudodesulfovibrio sp. S3]|nr:hypothetical protein DWB63_09945 [Pseudodesulfovibrio sp. S3]
MGQVLLISVCQKGAQFVIKAVQELIANTLLEPQPDQQAGKAWQENIFPPAEDVHLALGRCCPVKQGVFESGKDAL